MQCESQMEELCKEKDASKAHIEEIQRETSQLADKKTEIEVRFFDVIYARFSRPGLTWISRSRKWRSTSPSRRDFWRSM
jgi:hypothetical protein